MTKKILLLSVLAILAISIASFISHTNYAFSHSDGSQGAGYSASPGDGNTSCATGGCHTSSSTVTGWITSNIPGTGYVPSTAYTITLTMSGGSHGFEITSEKSGGAKVGTFSSTSGVSLYNSNRSAVSTTMVSSKTLTWTAPATGNGPVTFYACFASSKTNARKCTYTVSESTVGLCENTDNSVFSFFPNPVQDAFEINYSLDTKSNVEINMYSIDGNKISSLLNEEQASGSYTEYFQIKNYTAKGIYIIELKIADHSTYKKIIVE